MDFRQNSEIGYFQDLFISVISKNINNKVLMKIFYLFIFMLLSLFLLNSCNWDGSPPDRVDLATIKMYNSGNYPVHLFTTGEDFNAENKVEPGANRSKDFVTFESVENNSTTYVPFDIVVTAGSGGQVITTKTVIVETDKTYKVYFNGSGFD